MKTKRAEGRDEPILDPGLPIVDAQHHLFDLSGNRYMAEELRSDVSAGHNIIATVYCETQQFLHQHAPEWLRPLGEVEFANEVGAIHADGKHGSARICAGIIGHANLTFGSKIGDLLDQCVAIAPNRFRGIRHVTIDYPDERPFRYIMTFRPPAGVLDHPDFPSGLAELDRRSLTFDAAIFDPSLPALTKLVDRFPTLIFVLNHMGTAVGIDMSSEEKAEVFAKWRASLRELARRPNVRCKVGGLGQPMWGFRFEERGDVLGYVELAAAWRPFVETAVEAFGADRCMMESNFPPDGRSCGYVPLWNALKHICRSYSDDEKADLFHRTATRTYSLNLDI